MEVNVVNAKIPLLIGIKDLRDAEAELMITKHRARKYGEIIVIKMMRGHYMVSLQKAKIGEEVEERANDAQTEDEELDKEERSLVHG